MYNYFYAKKSTFRRNIMKERYNIEISDIQLSVVSDEPEDFVNSIVQKINDESMTLSQYSASSIIWTIRRMASRVGIA